MSLQIIKNKNVMQSGGLSSESISHVEEMVTLPGSLTLDLP